MSDATTDKAESVTEILRLLAPLRHVAGIDAKKQLIDRIPCSCRIKAAMLRVIYIYSLSVLPDTFLRVPDSRFRLPLTLDGFRFFFLYVLLVQCQSQQVVSLVANPSPKYLFIREHGALMCGCTHFTIHMLSVLLGVRTNCIYTIIQQNIFCFQYGRIEHDWSHTVMDLSDETRNSIKL